MGEHQFEELGGPGRCASAGGRWPGPALGALAGSAQQSVADEVPKRSW